ncbi:MAG: hypothetical protein L0271_22420, partial [Gemmatimonadetes bacterium]|nr:hypothetical protein [Gemmatimonadota bacterium]
TCADGRSRSVFTDVTIIGAFTNGAASFAGTVAVADVPVCLTPIVAGNQLLANGTLQPGFAPTYASTGGSGTVSGTLNSLTFTNAGAVSVATVVTTFNVNGTGNVTVTARAVVVAAPLQTIACEAGVAALCTSPLVRDTVAAVIVA